MWMCMYVDDGLVGVVSVYCCVEVLFLREEQAKQVSLLN